MAKTDQKPDGLVVARVAEDTTLCMRIWPHAVTELAAVHRVASSDEWLAAAPSVSYFTRRQGDDSKGTRAAGAER